MPITILLPTHFNRFSMYGVISEALDGNRIPRSDVINFDFSRLGFIEPDGVTALCNLIEYLRTQDVTGNFEGANRHGRAICYLDDCGIFEMYTGSSLRSGSASRSTTLPYKFVPPSESHAYLDLTVSPWLANALGVTPAALAELRASIREIFSNIADHSTQNIGGIHIQHFPNRNKVCVSVSDFGIGIPASILSSFSFGRDCDAINHALVEGVSTRSGPRHSGFGLHYLVQNVVGRNRGHVNIYSNHGQVVCFPGREGTRRVLRDVGGKYPGTLVAIDLNTNRLEQAEQEDLEW